MKQTSIQNACRCDEELKYELSCKDNIISVSVTCVKCKWEIGKRRVYIDDINKSDYNQEFIGKLYDFLREN